MGTCTKSYHLQTDMTINNYGIIQAVESLGDYAPPNQDFSISAARAIEAQMLTAQQNEERILREAAIIREEVNAAAWELHEVIKGIKLYVDAQYGSDSPALHAVGLKRSSERKRPVRRK